MTVLKPYSLGNISFLINFLMQVHFHVEGTDASRTLWLNIIVKGAVTNCPANFNNLADIPSGPVLSMDLISRCISALSSSMISTVSTVGVSKVFGWVQLDRQCWQSSCSVNRPFLYRL